MGFSGEIAWLGFKRALLRCTDWESMFARLDPRFHDEVQHLQAGMCQQMLKQTLNPNTLSPKTLQPQSPPPPNPPFVQAEFEATPSLPEERSARHGPILQVIA